MTGPAIYYPSTVQDTVELLDAHGGAAKPVAGGTALTLMLSQGLVSPEALVSLRTLPGMRDIGLIRVGSVDHVRIGALVTHIEAARHPLVQQHLPAAATAFALVGNAQVRAAATVGGVVAEADYASDPPAVLVALDAVVIVTGVAGERRVPIAEFLVSFYQTTLEHDEIVVAVEIPLLTGRVFSTYLKYTSRSYEDRPCVGVAALACFDDEGRCIDLRAAVGAASDVPLRLRDVEAEAAGRLDGPSALEEVSRAYSERIDPIADIRGSAWYRREMVQVWVNRALRAVTSHPELSKEPT